MTKTASAGTRRSTRTPTTARITGLTLAGHVTAIWRRWTKRNVMKKRRNICKPIHVDSLTIGICRHGFFAWDMQRDCLFAEKSRRNHRCKWASPDGICLNDGALDDAKGSPQEDAGREAV